MINKGKKTKNGYMLYHENVKCPPIFLGEHLQYFISNHIAKVVWRFKREVSMAKRVFNRRFEKLFTVLAVGLISKSHQPLRFNSG